MKFLSFFVFILCLGFDLEEKWFFCRVFCYLSSGIKCLVFMFLLRLSIGFYKVKYLFFNESVRRFSGVKMFLYLEKLVFVFFELIFKDYVVYFYGVLGTCRVCV